LFTAETQRFFDREGKASVLSVPLRYKKFSVLSAPLRYKKFSVLSAPLR
jgi:hypothetical protein